MSPKISVITICFNNLSELKASCDSVDRQAKAPFEHWIIDGSTTGEIREFLENHAQPSYRKWISERDKGIADAFNKGIERSRGEIINLLNSGDCFFSAEVLGLVQETFLANPSITWLHGKCQTQRGGKEVVLGKPFEKAKLYRGMRSVWHQTIFLKKSLHETYGLYDPGLNIAMDYDFLCRMADEPFIFLKQQLVIFAPHGISQTSYLQSLKQMEEVYTKHFGRSLKLKIWHLRLRILYYLLNGPFGKFLYAVKTRLKLENI